MAWEPPLVNNFAVFVMYIHVYIQCLVSTATVRRVAALDQHQADGQEHEAGTPEA